LFFYAIRVISKERRLVLPRPFCAYYKITFLSVCVFVCPPKIFEAYEIVLLSVCSPYLC
jgi:hypothetical protein